MSFPELTTPLVFEPLFMERIWGGRRLEARFGKRLPAGVLVGESWEIVDRPEAQSVVHDGPLRGRTLHEIWMDEREAVFGKVADAPRFPLLVKLLDAQEKLSLQVHPPAAVAAELGGEPKTECWYIADATPMADLYVGMKVGSDRASFESAIASGEAEHHVHRVSVKAGDAMFLPSGRVHAIGAGNVIVEVQQNSDTTYRVFDWNRTDEAGVARTLHVEESLRCIDFDDCEPALIEAKGETLIENALFHLQRWELSSDREAVPSGAFAIICCLTGKVDCAGVELHTGGFCLIPATLPERTLRPAAPETTLLRITVPDQSV